MTELPVGWAMATVSELSAANGVTDGPFGSNMKTEHYTSDGPRVIRLQNIGDGRFIDERAHISRSHFVRLAKHAVEAGDVVVASLGEQLPRACIAPESLGPAIVKADCIRVRPNPEVNASYVMFALNSPQARAATASTIKGVGRPRVNLGDLRRLQIPLAPPPEQERIVAAIEEAFSKLDAGEAGLRTVRQLLKRMRDAILTAAVTGCLVAGEPRNDAFIVPERSQGGVPILPRSWASTQLGDLLDGIDAGKSFATQGGPAQGGEIGVIKVSAMTWGQFRPTENKALPPGTAIDDRWFIRAGDLLLSRANTAEYVGACVLVPEDHDQLILSDKSLRLRPKPGVDSRWLLYFLRSRPARDQIERLATGTKESMRNISQAKLRSVRLAVPPTVEQKYIADEVERQFSFIDACERAVDAGLARSAALRRSVLKAAFEGRLVPQDPSDEPASVLLERIRAERAAQPTVKRRARRSA